MAAYVRQPTISPTARKTQGKGGWKIKKQSIPDKSFPSAEARKRAGGTSTSRVQTSKGQRQRDWTSRRSACTPAQPRYGQGLWTEAVERVREEVTWQPSLPATPLRLLPAPHPWTFRRRSSAAVWITSAPQNPNGSGWELKIHGRDP